MPIECELVRDPAGLARYVADWDALAVATSQPYCAPGWMMAWWEHAAPPDAELRVVAVRDGDGLAGVTPFYAERHRGGTLWLRPLGAGTAARLGPLARPGSERAVAGAAAAALAQAHPAPAIVAFEETRDGDGWPEWLARSWPGGPARVHRHPYVRAPGLALDAAGFDDWLARKSSNFRQQLRRARRQLEGRGAQFRVSTDGPALLADLRAFARLHTARWSDRGGSSSLGDGVEEMLADAAGRLPEGRMRVYSIDVDGEPISSQVFVAAGDELSYWNGGFDERFARERPAIQALAFAIEDGFRLGARRIDLGPGEQDYKYRLADGDEPLGLARVVAPGPLNRLRYAPEGLRRLASERLDDDQKARLRRIMRGGRR
jgi:CelD/BcsL family acetyltransferase involved in cellulose biosynthesis